MSSFAALLAAKKQELSARNRAKTAKIPDGNSRWRILPSWRGGEGEQFWHDFGAHYVKKLDGSMGAVYLCTEKTFGRPCDVCAAVGHGIKTATDDNTLKMLEDAKAAARVLVNAIQLDAPPPKNNEVQILEMPPSVFAQIIEIAGEWVTEGVNIVDIAAGKDLVIGRTGTGKNTKYTVQVAAKSTVLDRGVLTKLHNLDDYVKQESADQMSRALNAVRAVVGALPVSSGPALAAPAGGLPAGATIVDDDPYAVATPPKRAAVNAGPSGSEITDVPVRQAAAPAPAPATQVVDDAGTGDDELDAMLKGLG